MKRSVCVLLLGVVAAACGSTPSAPAQPTTTPPVFQVQACATWANTLRASGLPAATGTKATYREALYAAAGGVKSVGGTSYAVWFPTNWASTSPRRLVFGLHGTDGNAEEDWWFNWKDSTRDRNWAYVGLTYLNATTGAYDDEVAAYANMKSTIDDVRASCDFGSPSTFLVGFSRGSAMTFGVAYLDIKDRRLFKAFGNNSGAWPVDSALTPTLQGIVTRNERSAYAGGKFWMYCGALDRSQDAPMCTAMDIARTFVTGYGGTVVDLFQDPTGGHGGLATNPTALSSLYAYFESLR